MASDRERILYEKAREKMLQVQSEMMKHFNQGDDVQDAK
jgi:ribosomal protein L21E